MQVTSRFLTIGSFFFVCQCLRQYDLARLNLFPSKSAQQNYVHRLMQAGIIRSTALPWSTKTGRPECLYYLTKKGVSLLQTLLPLNFLCRTSPPSTRNLRHHLEQVTHILDLKLKWPTLKLLADFNFVQVACSPRPPKFQTTVNKSVLELTIPHPTASDQSLILKPDLQVSYQQKQVYVEVDLESEDLKILALKLDKYQALHEAAEKEFKGVIISVPTLKRRDCITTYVTPKPWLRVVTRNDFLGATAELLRQ